MRPPYPRTRGLRPLDPFSGYCLTEGIKLVSTVAERNAEDELGAVVLLARRRSRQPGCKASGEIQGIIPREKFTFSLGFSRLSWARNLQTFRSPSVAGGGH